MALWSALISRPARTGLSTRPSPTLFFLLVGTFLLTLVPHVAQLPLWVSLAVIAAMVIRSVQEFYRWPLPSTTFCSLLALCLLAGILLQFGNVFGRDAGTAFTAGLMAIKFFELRGPRDIMVIIFSCFFVVMSALLYSQVIELFIYCLIMMWVLTALLLRTQMGDLTEDSLLHLLKMSGVIFLQALPLTIILFFAFPRYSGKLEVNLGEASLGFTDTIKPGDIAALSQNDTEAMYVRFLSAKIPNTDTMYWRGLVLWHYQDGAWTAGKLAEAPIPEHPSATPGSDLIEQEITVYPHFQKWLFALDFPVTSADDPSEPQPWSTTLNGDILQLFDPKNKVDHRERYRVTSSFTLNDQILTKDEKEEGIQLPGENPQNNPNDTSTYAPDDTIDPDIQALADRLHSENPDEQAYIHAALRYFRQEHFVYNASPGIEGERGKWLHNFLFTTKAGFCEHFAAAFAVLMRSEHIPTRLVVGYYGASYNPYKNIYTVKQSNAHAWDEVWIDAKNQPATGQEVGRWLRVDPTATLPPAAGNVPSGSNDSGQEGAPDELSIQVAHHRLTFSETYFPGWALRGIIEMHLRHEQVEADWDDLVFSYDPEAQNRLAQALGFRREGPYALALVCLLAVGICVIVFRKVMKRKPPIPPVENLYAQFCRNMAQRGIPRATWEGPLAYTGRVAEAFPEKEEAIRDVGRIVAQARYGSTPNEATAPKELKSLLLLITATRAASSSRERR